MTINGVRSTTVDLGIGIPQGSVLGPLLFLVYVILLRLSLSVATTVMPTPDSCTTQFHLRDQDSYRQALCTAAGDVRGGGQGLDADQQAHDQQRQDRVHGHHDSALPDHLPSAAAGCALAESACSSVLLLQPWRHHGLHRGNAWPDPKRQVRHVLSPAHHQQHQTLPG